MGKKKIRNLKIELQETLLLPQRKGGREPWKNTGSGKRDRVPESEPGNTKKEDVYERGGILESTVPQRV